MTIRRFLGVLLGLEREREVPRDLADFREAKARLKKNSKAFAREVDRFGELVSGMREEPPPTKKPARRAATKRKSG